ncbi:Tetratricopeptide repeat protein 7B, partial [Trichinella spiralis]
LAGKDVGQKCAQYVDSVVGFVETVSPVGRHALLGAATSDGAGPLLVASVRVVLVFGPDVRPGDVGDSTLSAIEYRQHRRGGLVSARCTDFCRKFWRLRSGCKRPCVPAFFFYCFCFAQAIEMAESAYRSTDNVHMKSRCLLLVGLAMSLKVDSRPSTVHLDRSSMTRRRPEAVLTVLKRAAVLDPSDYMAEFYLALEYAFDGRLELAECHCRRSFALCQDSPTTAFLLALLLTAKNRLAEALQLVDEAVVEHPRHSALLVLRLKLLVKLSQEDGTQSATERSLFAAAKELLMLWRIVQQDPFRSPTPSEMKAPSSIGAQEQQRCHLLAHSTAHLSAGSGSCTGAGNYTDQGDHDSTTFTGLTGPAADVSVVAADSGDTSSEDLSLHFSELSMGAMTNQARLRGEGTIWLELAEILLQLGMVDEVEQCLAEAYNSCCSQTFQILYLKGRVFHVLEQLANAKACYKTTLSLFAGHTAATRHLALIYQAEGNYSMAEKLLRDVVRAEPVNFENWFSLAELFSIRQANVEAADCFAIALDLYHSSPLIPFSVIPRTLKHL